MASSPKPGGMLTQTLHPLVAMVNETNYDLASTLLTDHPMETGNFSPMATVSVNSTWGHATMDDTTGNVPMATPGHSWPVLLLCPIILCTVAGNVLVCLAIGKDQKLQTFTNYFLFSMAMADLMVATLVMPFGLAKDLLGYWPMGHVMCNIWTTLDVFCCTSSILHMCTVSIDRYIAICDPLRHKRQPRTRMGIVVKICIVWACAAGLSSPLCIIGFIQSSTVINGKVCALTNIHFMIYGSVVAFFIPLCIVVVTYTMTTYTLYKKTQLSKKTESEAGSQRDNRRTYPHIIFQMVKPNRFENVPTTKDDRSTSTSSASLSKKSNPVLPDAFPTPLSREGSSRRSTQSISVRRTMSHNSHNGTITKRLNTEERASKVLGLVFAAFVAGWTPFFVANTVVAGCPACINDDRVFIICTWIGWAASMFNPIIYTAFNIRFRQAFLRILTCNRLYPLTKRNSGSIPSERVLPLERMIQDRTPNGNPLCNNKLLDTLHEV